MKYEAHPAAEVFPLMPKKDFTILTDSIKRNGQNKAIELLDGLIIDGRDRQRACEAAGVIPIYTDIQTDDPIEYVLVCNEHRKHYTTRQRAAIAADLATLKVGNPNRESIGSFDPIELSNEQAASKMNVSPASVKRAKKRKADDPEAHEKVKRGEKVVKTKTEKVRLISWTDIAMKHGVLPKTAGGVQKRKLKEEMLIVDDTLEFPRRGLNPGQARQVDVVCEDLRRRKDPLGDKAIAEKIVNELPTISVTAKQKLDSAIRAHIRVLDGEAEYHLQERLKQELAILLPDYNEAHDKNIEFVNSYHGVMTHAEYKLVIGLLHADKYPGIDDVQRARLDKGFHILKTKKELLCGLSDRNKLSNSLPKTVADLWARRK